MDNLSSAPVTQAFGTAGLAAGTTTTYTLAPSPAPLPFAIRSKTYTKAAVTNAATPTTDLQTGVAFKPVPVGSGSVFVWGVNASGAVGVAQGSIEALDVSNNFILAPQQPALPDTYCPIAYLTVKVGSTGAAWTLGTSNLAGPPTGVVFAFANLSMPVDRPQIA